MAKPIEVVLLCPNEWDELHLLPLDRISRVYDVTTYGPDAEKAPEEFDADKFISDAASSLRPRMLSGVTSSSDYPGCLVAAFVARDLGLPGPTPQSMLRCSHKYYSRLSQSYAVPEATPAFTLLDPDRLTADSVSFAYPIFVKPVKSWFSQHARRIDSFDELLEFVRSPGVRWHLQNFIRPFEQLLARFDEFTVGARYMIAEELLTGHQVTLEGFILEGRATLIGIVDSSMYKASPSFERFDYPSVISDPVAERMLAISERALIHAGFDKGIFNIEFFYNSEQDSIHIIEVNPRMCGQFADLMLGVNGVSTYEILLALAVGKKPRAGSGIGRCLAGTSFALRHFSNAIVAKVPNGDSLSRVRQWNVTMVANFYTVGTRLSDQDFQYDGFSYRYAVINMLGHDRASITRNFARVRDELQYELLEVT